MSLELSDLPLTFQSPRALVIAASALMVIAAGAALIRRPGMPKLAPFLCAAVEKLEARDATTVGATIRNRAATTQALLMNGTDAPRTSPPQGRSVVVAHPAAGVADVSAILRGHDPWPENNALTLRLPPPAQ